MMENVLMKNFKKILVYSALGLMLMSCHSGQEKASESLSVDTLSQEPAEVPYTLAKNYFVRNDYDASQLSSPKITTQDAFEKVFGMATVMGENGKPTPIDFSEQFAIALILPTTSNAVELKVKALELDKDQLVLRYEQNEGEVTSMKMQPFLLLLVDKKYDQQVVVEELK